MTAQVQPIRSAPGPVPKPDLNSPIPHPEDFAAWCEHPVTRFVAAAWAHAAQAQCEAWMRESWQTGLADLNKLIELKTRADAYNAFMEAGLEQYVAIIEQA